MTRDKLGEGSLCADRLAHANIHPETGLATDYLNHFNEVVMLIDMLPMMPECIGDVLDWRPRSYIEHFEASHFKEKALAIAAYAAVEPARRAALENTAAMADLALGSIQRLIENADDDLDETLERVAHLADIQVKPLLEHASGLINGGPVAHPEASDHTMQTTIDALFP